MTEHLGADNILALTEALALRNVASGTIKVNALLDDQYDRARKDLQQPVEIEDWTSPRRQAQARRRCPAKPRPDNHRRPRRSGPRSFGRSAAAACVGRPSVHEHGKRKPPATERAWIITRNGDTRRRL